MQVRSSMGGGLLARRDSLFLLGRRHTTPRSLARSLARSVRASQPRQGQLVATLDMNASSAAFSFPFWSANVFLLLVFLTYSRVSESNFFFDFPRPDGQLVSVYKVNIYREFLVVF